MAASAIRQDAQDESVMKALAIFIYVRKSNDISHIARQLVPRSQE